MSVHSPTGDTSRSMTSRLAHDAMSAGTEIQIVVHRVSSHRLLARFVQLLTAEVGKDGEERSHIVEER